MNFFSMFLGPSWKTSALGILGGLTMLLPEVQHALKGEPVNLNAVFTAFTVAGVGIAAKDGNVSHSVTGSPSAISSIVSALEPMINQMIAKAPPAPEVQAAPRAQPVKL
jgi:hypothetical protein